MGRREARNGSDSAEGHAARHGLMYALVPFAATALSTVMVAFYTDWLTRDEMGVSQVVDLFLALAIELLGISVLQGMLRFYFVHPGKRDRDAVVSSTILIGGGLAWLSCGAALLFVDELRPLFIGSPTPEVSAEYLNDVLRLVLLIAPFVMTSKAGLRYLVIRQRAGLYAGVQLAKMLFELGIKVWLVAPFGLGLGVRGILISVLMGEALTTLFLTGWVLSQVGLRIDRSVFVPLLRFSFPLLLASLCQLVLQRADLRLLEFLTPDGAGFAAVGVYGLGYRIGYLANVIILFPFMQVFLPRIFAVVDTREQAAQLARWTTFALGLVSAATVALSVFAREAVLAIDLSPGNQYEAAAGIVPLVGGAYLFWTVYRAMAETSYQIAKRTSALSWFSFVALLTNVGLNFWMIPRWGALGAALSTLVAYMVLALVGERGRRRLNGSSLSYAHIVGCLAIVGMASSLAALADAQLAEPGRFSTAAAATKLALLLAAEVLIWRLVLAADLGAFLARVRGREV